MFKHTLALFAAALSIISVNAFADNAADIEVEQPYVREVPPGAMATGSFMTLTNMSDQDIQLVQAKSNAAKKVELHTHVHDNGVMKMRQIPAIKVPADGQAHLKPGGLHIMLIGLQDGIQAGQTIEMTLIFKDGSEKSISMPVKSVMSHSGHVMSH